MFKVKHKKTGEILEVFSTFYANGIYFICYEDNRWSLKSPDKYEPYKPLGNFKVGEKYKYLAGFNNYDYVEIKEIKGDFAKVHSNIINDSIIIGLDELIREDFDD